jgi:hypothetical protein
MQTFSVHMSRHVHTLARAHLHTCRQVRTRLFSLTYTREVVCEGCILKGFGILCTRMHNHLRAEERDHLACCDGLCVRVGTNLAIGVAEFLLAQMYTYTHVHSGTHKGLQAETRERMAGWVGWTEIPRNHEGARTETLMTRTSALRILRLLSCTKEML